jgi:hypothetical protein
MTQGLLGGAATSKLGEGASPIRFEEYGGLFTELQRR